MGKLIPRTYVSVVSLSLISYLIFINMPFFPYYAISMLILGVLD
jgi:hypothetical protein